MSNDGGSVLPAALAIGGGIRGKMNAQDSGGRWTRAMAKASDLPQPTFQEARAVAIAISDAAADCKWKLVEGDTSAYHPGDGKLSVRMAPRTARPGQGELAAVDVLSELKELEWAAVPLFYQVLALTIKNDHTQVTLDHLIDRIGWRPQTTAEREAMKNKLWRWLSILNRIQVIGTRDGRYRDPKTREVLDMKSHGCLVVINSIRQPVQASLDDSELPLEVSLAASAWLGRFIKRSDILTYCGSLQRVACIPSGKPSGMWAQAIGFALQQMWRERAARPDGNRRWQFRRCNLLRMFSLQPDIDALLQSADPGRAREYWRGAIRHLQKAVVIGVYSEIGSLPARRQGWQREWLNQQVEIYPPAELIEDLSTIAARAQSVRKKTRRRKLDVGTRV